LRPRQRLDQWIERIVDFNEMGKFHGRHAAQGGGVVESMGKAGL